MLLFLLFYYKIDINKNTQTIHTTINDLRPHTCSNSSNIS